MSWLGGTLRFCLLAGIFACSTSSSSGPPGNDCSADPSQCAAGTTCWPVDGVPNMRCIASQSGAVFGASCTLSPARATCGDGLACDQSSIQGGSCTPYCGTNLPACPAGFRCDITHVGSADGPAIEICRPAPPSNDGGLGDDGGGDDGGNQMT